MASNKLPNYLRSNRKRLALSQDEVAFLLGGHGGAKVSRYEHFDREPTIATALALEAIFQKPVRELFVGIYQIKEAEVMERAKIMNRRVHLSDSKIEEAKKRQWLAKLSAPRELSPAE